MNTLRLSRLIPVVVLFLGACAAVKPQTHFTAVRDLGNSRVTAEVVWSQTPGEIEDHYQQALTLAQDGLTREDAVQIAVLNNRALQAELENLGLAAAELTQAGLPQNPTFDAIVAFPTNIANSGLGFAGWLSDLWQLPRRKRVAEIAARQAEYRAALQVMVTAYNGARAWDALVAAQQLLQLEQQLLETRHRMTQRLRIRYAQGLADTITMEEAAALEFDQEVAVHEAEQRLTQAATLLSQTLALDNAAGFVPSVELEVISSEPVLLAATLQHAMENRLDLAVARAEVERMAKQRDLERALIWKAVTIGPEWEGDFMDVEGGDNSIGPAISIEIPIFDYNQAGIAAATYELRRATRRLEALQRKTAKEVVDHYRGLERTHASLNTLEDSLIKSSERRLAYVKEWNQKMQLPYVEVLAAQAHYLEVQHRIVQTRKMLNDQWRMLHIATLGGSSS